MQTRTKSSLGSRRGNLNNKSRKGWGWLLVIILLILVAIVITMLVKNKKSTTQVNAIRLTCYSDQDVTPFGQSVLYYDNASLHCLAGNGAIRWSFPVGANASFHAANGNIVLWQGNQLYILDGNGRCTYNELLSAEIQFARAGSQYVAAVLGEETKPNLVVRDLQGTQVDEESDAFSGLLILDVGFHGNNGEDMWVLTMDVYSTALNSQIFTFLVGKMNTGEASLGDKLVYSVIYENEKLRVFSTQQMYSFNYKAVQESTGNILIYGWKLLDHYLPRYGDALMLMSTTNQTGTNQSIKDLRLISGNALDRRYTLPTECVGAMVKEKSIFAFSGSYMYRVDINSQMSYAYASPLPEGETIDGYLGKTMDGKVLLTSGSSVFIVTLPD